MAHTDRTYRTGRPAREVTFYDFNADGSVDTLTITQEFGRRSGLNEHRSQVSERRRRANKRLRRVAKVQLRRDADSVELVGPRGQANWLAVS